MKSALVDSKAQAAVDRNAGDGIAHDLAKGLQLPAG